MNIPTNSHIDKRKCKAIDVYLNLADHMWLGCLSKRNLQVLISSGPRFTSNLFVVLSSPKYDTSFLVFRAWPGFLVALLQMTVFKCTYVPQSRGELLHHQLVTRETMQASGLGGDVGGTVTPLSPLEQPQLAFWGGAWTLEAAKRRRGPHFLTLPLDSTQTPISSMGTHFTLHEYCNLSLSLWHLTNL